MIMFDGPDGVGKTTQIELAARALEATNYAVYTTRIHGGTPIGEALRKVVLSNLKRHAKTDLFILSGIYNELSEDLRKKRRTGMIILVDRSPLSMIAYQAYGSGLDKARAYQAADEALASFAADLILVYQANSSLFLKRFANPADYFQDKPPEYFERVTAGYADAAQRYNAVTIDASKTADEVHAASMEHIRKLLQATTS